MDFKNISVNRPIANEISQQQQETPITAERQPLSGGIADINNSIEQAEPQGPTDGFSDLFASPEASISKFATPITHFGSLPQIDAAPMSYDAAQALIQELEGMLQGIDTPEAKALLQQLQDLESKCSDKSGDFATGPSQDVCNQLAKLSNEVTAVAHQDAVKQEEGGTLPIAADPQPVSDASDPAADAPPADAGAADQAPSIDALPDENVANDADASPPADPDLDA